MHIMSLQTLKDLSRLRKKRRLWPLLYTASIVGRPLQFIIQHHPQVFTGLNSLYLPSINADWLVWSFRHKAFQQWLLMFFSNLIDLLLLLFFVLIRNHCKYFYWATWQFQFPPRGWIKYFLFYSNFAVVSVESLSTLFNLPMWVCVWKRERQETFTYICLTSLL